MNSLEVVVGASLEELAEVGSGAREGQYQEGAAARAGLSMVLKTTAAFRTAIRGANTEPKASYTAHPRRLGKGSKHLRSHGGEADSITLPPLLIPVSRVLLHETDNLATTQAGLLPDGDPVSSVDTSPSSGA